MLAKLETVMKIWPWRAASLEKPALLTFISGVVPSVLAHQEELLEIIQYQIRLHQKWSHSSMVAMAAAQLQLIESR